MATVNPYFQSGVPMGRASEQNLYEDIIIECLKIYGFELYYLPRKSYNEDRILGEDPLNKYEHAYPIEMYLENDLPLVVKYYVASLGEVKLALSPLPSS